MQMDGCAWEGAVCLDDKGCVSHKAHRPRPPLESGHSLFPLALRFARHVPIDAWDALDFCTYTMPQVHCALRSEQHHTWRPGPHTQSRPSAGDKNQERKPETRNASIVS